VLAIDDMSWLVIIIMIIVIIVLLRKWGRWGRYGRWGGYGERDIYTRSTAARRVATDDAPTVIAEHIDNPDDALVLIYNRPDLADDFRDDILTRLQAGIINAEGTAEIPRFVDAGRLLGVDFMPIATEVTARVAVDDVRRLGATDVIARGMKVAEDPQNVHDPSVIKQMNDTLDALESPVVMSTQEVKMEINKKIDSLIEAGEITRLRGDDARCVLVKMIEDGGTCTSYGGRHEADILSEAWSATKSDTQKENIILGLADSMDDGHVVCVNGRIARVIGANTTQVTSGDLKAAAYAYAGSIYSSLGDDPADIISAMAKVDEYVNGLTMMPEDQRALVREECRAVFADVG
jgi:hypothetical protein